ncbi:MAG: alpha/beta hydrolase [Bacteroidaceae bacterium]|nr:alpha/beta hydrolase [Bacteroidaceae bacterium]
MKRTVFVFLLLGFICDFLHAREYEVSGPQGGLSMTVTLPKGFDAENDSCPMVILMHGIFSSKNITPMPAIAKALAKEGIASVRFNFGGHWSSEGKMQRMTIENEIADALAMWEYACSLPYVTEIGLLGHSQGGVVASMTAGRVVSMGKYGKRPSGLVLIAPASVLKNACNNGRLLGAKFDPVSPPEFIRCFGVMKVGREYILSTQKLDIYGTAKPYEGPVMIIHGSKDTLVPMWCSEEFKNTYGDAAELIVVENENHRISRKTKKVAALAASFFKENM